MLRVASEQAVTRSQVRAFAAQGLCGCVSANAPSNATLDLLIDAGSDIIATVTGMRATGRRTLVARPCRYEGSCDPCSCCDVDVIPIGDQRPDNIVAKVDGVTIDTWVHWNGWTWVVARASIDGARPLNWPSTQKRWLADTEEDTFSITFDYGLDLDQHIITAAALEVICDLAQDNTIYDNLLDGVTSVEMGGVDVTIDPNRLAEAGDTRLSRIANGELGPHMRRMMGIMFPTGRTASTVWAPELMMGWQMNLSVLPPGSA